MGLSIVGVSPHIEVYFPPKLQLEHEEGSGIMDNSICLSKQGPLYTKYCCCLFLVHEKYCNAKANTEETDGNKKIRLHCL